MTEVAKKCSQMKIVLEVTKSLLHLFLAMCGILQISMVLHGLLLSYMAFYGLIWPCMVLYGLVWFYMAFYGLSWQNIDLIGLVSLVSSFLAVIDPNSFGLVLENTHS